MGVFIMGWLIKMCSPSCSKWPYATCIVHTNVGRVLR